MNAGTMNGDSAEDMFRRIGVIGDVHTEDKSLLRVVEYFEDANVDAILCTGDLTDGPNRESSVDRCCALLQAKAITTVCGNHDRWAIEGEQRDLVGASLHADLAPDTIAFLNALPTTYPFATVAGRGLLCHGLESNDMASVKPFDHGVALSDNEALQSMLSPRKFDFVINGHSHRRMVRTIDDLTIINAGTLHRDHEPGFVIVDFAREKVECFDLTSSGEIVATQELPLR